MSRRRAGRVKSEGIGSGGFRRLGTSSYQESRTAAPGIHICAFRSNPIREGRIAQSLQPDSSRKDGPSNHARGSLLPVICVKKAVVTWRAGIAPPQLRKPGGKVSNGVRRPAGNRASAEIPRPSGELG